MQSGKYFQGKLTCWLTPCWRCTLTRLLCSLSLSLPHELGTGGGVGSSFKIYASLLFVVLEGLLDGSDGSESVNFGNDASPIGDSSHDSVLDMIGVSSSRELSLKLRDDLQIDEAGELML